jgi:hypothetical protein
MFLILLVLGILLTTAGGALVGFEILFNELPAGMPLLLVGMLAVVGGLVLIGLSAVVQQLARISAALTPMQPAAFSERVPEISAPQAEVPPVARQRAKETVGIIEVPAMAPIARPEAAPNPPVVTPAADVSASAIERLRSIIPRPEKVSPEAGEVVPLSPNGQLASHHVEPAPPSIGGAVVETQEPRIQEPRAQEPRAQEPRLDFLFRQRPARSVPQQPEIFESLWPRRMEQEEEQLDPRLDVPRAPSAAPGRRAVPAGEAAPEAAPVRAVTILKSGVVDGMAYTLYADGSIEAQLPQGMVRFGSIAELRAHIESNV